MLAWRDTKSTQTGNPNGEGMDQLPFDFGQLKESKCVPSKKSRRIHLNGGIDSRGQARGALSSTV